MAAHSVVAARSQRRFHFGTRVTLAGNLQHYVANVQLVVFEGQQIQTRHHDVPANKGGVEGVAASEGGYYGQVFGLDERDVAVARLPALVVAE